MIESRFPIPTGFDTWASFLQHQGIPEERWNDASAVVDPDGKGPRIFFQRVIRHFHFSLNAIFFPH